MLMFIILYSCLCLCFLRSKNLSRMLYTFSQRFGGAARKATEHNKLCPFQGCTAQARKTEKHLNNGHFSRLSHSHSLSLSLCLCLSL